MRSASVAVAVVGRPRATPVAWPEGTQRIRVLEILEIIDIEDAPETRDHRGSQLALPPVADVAPSFIGRRARAAYTTPPPAVDSRLLAIA